uniref:Zinc finger protein 711 n=1 Tax=Cacopsylla melanoneura TaxID=428564 RepID=A0A8D9E2L2_9HEMI
MYVVFNYNFRPFFWKFFAFSNKNIAYKDAFKRIKSNLWLTPLCAQNSQEFVPCQYCRLELPKITELLVDHSKSCHIPERNSTYFSFVCVLCSYHTYMRNSMKYHVRKHLGERPFKCKYCSFASGRQSSITSHVKIKHPGVQF